MRPESASMSIATLARSTCSNLRASRAFGPPLALTPFQSKPLRRARKPPRKRHSNGDWIMSSESVTKGRFVVPGPLEAQLATTSAAIHAVFPHGATLHIQGVDYSLTEVI